MLLTALTLALDDSLLKPTAATPVRFERKKTPMAHTNQQRKRIRQDAKRNVAKTGIRSRLRGLVKKLENVLAGKKDGDVTTEFKGAMSALAKGARKGAISKGSAKRKVSRLAARAKAAKTAAK